MLTLDEPGFRLVLLLEEGQAQEGVRNVDGWITIPDAGTWTATFLTLAELTRLMDRWQRTGEYLSGAYFTCPDLVLLRDSGVDSILVAVRDLVENRGYENVLVRAED